VANVPRVLNTQLKRQPRVYYTWLTCRGVSGVTRGSMAKWEEWTRGKLYISQQLDLPRRAHVLPCGYVALREVLYKVSLRYVALALVYLFALWVCDFTGGVVQGKSRVCGSSTRVFVCPAGMWLY
jgi:hypothetical protein